MAIIDVKDFHAVKTVTIYEENSVIHGFSMIIIDEEGFHTGRRRSCLVFFNTGENCNDLSRKQRRMRGLIGEYWCLDQSIQTWKVSLPKRTEVCALLFYKRNT